MEIELKMNLFLCKSILYLLLITNVTFSKKTWDVCQFGSVKCVCQNVPNNKLKVDCSGRRLLNIPTFSSNVIWVDLSNNHIEEITSGFPKNVRYIDLSGNKIQHLDGHPFRGLLYLKTLNLERNAINISLLYQGLFSDLHSLTELSFKGNIKHKIKQTIIKDEVFAELRSLKTLKIDGTPNATFGKGFANLTHLQNLDLSGITGNCSLKRISQNMFLYFTQLVYIDVSACSVSDIEKGAFGKLLKLEHLDVSHNRELGFESLPNITYNLKETSIKTLRANGINCLTGMGTMILKHHLENLKYTNISEIYFERNRLEQLEPQAIKLLPNNITLISFGENKLTTGRYLIDFISLKNIRVYNMSVQLRPPPYLESIFDSCKEKPDVLELTTTKFDMSENEKASSSSFRPRSWHLNYTIFLPKTLEVLYANMSRLYSRIPDCGVNATGLRELYIQDNFLSSWDGPVRGIENLEIVDMSNNYCSHISKSFLKYAKGVKFLKMSKNDIGKSLSNDREGEIFNNTKSLEVLDLSYNNIIALSEFVFKNMPQLQILNLQNNQISIWRVKINHMKNMKFINLKQNKFITFEKEARTSFENLFQTSNLMIDLSENQVLCSCENAHFLEWITLHKNNFKNIKRYECSLSSSQSFNFSDVEGSSILLKENCKSSLTEYITSAVLVVLLFSVVIYFLLKNKWKIKHVFSNGGIEEEVERYHAMISYSDKDLSIVLRYVVPNLETLGLRLFVRHRDDPQAGMSINAIRNSIYNSNNAVCLVTKNYLKSKRQCYELDMIRMHMESRIDHQENLINHQENLINNQENFFCCIIRFPNVSIPDNISALDNNIRKCPVEDGNSDDFWKALGNALR